jgi:hypothetical protein
MSYTRIAAAGLPGRICQQAEDCRAAATWSVEDYAARTFRPGRYVLMCPACLSALIEDEVVLAKAIARAVRLVVAQRRAVGIAGAEIGAHILETLQVVRDLTCDEAAYERVVDRIHGAAADAVELAQMPPVPAWLLPQSEEEAAESAGVSAAWHCTALDIRRC